MIDRLRDGKMERWKNKNGEMEGWGKRKDDALWRRWTEYGLETEKPKYYNPVCT